MGSVHCLGSVREFGVWKIESGGGGACGIASGRCHWHEVCFWSCGMAAVAGSPWPGGQGIGLPPQGPWFGPRGAGCLHGGSCDIVDFL